jgi:hypothetical protein
MCFCFNVEQLQLENSRLTEENETLREVTQLRRIPPKELVSRLRAENSKLHEFVQVCLILGLHFVSLH